MGLSVGVFAADETTVQQVSDLLAAAGHAVVAHDTAPDDRTSASTHFTTWIADPRIDVVISIATPASRAALMPLITKRLLGFSDLRDVDGARCDSTIVVLLPKDSLALAPALDKALPRIETELARKPTIAVPPVRAPAKVSIPAATRPAPGAMKPLPAVPAAPPTTPREQSVVAAIPTKKPAVAVKATVPPPIPMKVPPIAAVPAPAKPTTPPPPFPPSKTPPPMPRRDAESFASKTPAPPPATTRVDAKIGTEEIEPLALEEVDLAKIGLRGAPLSRASMATPARGVGVTGPSAKPASTVPAVGAPTGTPAGIVVLGDLADTLESGDRTTDSSATSSVIVATDSPNVRATSESNIVVDESLGETATSSTHAAMAEPSPAPPPPRPTLPPTLPPAPPSAKPPVPRQAVATSTDRPHQIDLSSVIAGGAVAGDALSLKPRRRKPWALIGIAGLALAGAGLFMTTRSSSSSAPTTTARTSTVTASDPTGTDAVDPNAADPRGAEPTHIDIEPDRGETGETGVRPTTRRPARPASDVSTSGTTTAGDTTNGTSTTTAGTTTTAKPGTAKPGSIIATAKPAAATNAQTVGRVSADGCDKVSCVIDAYARPCCAPFRPRKAGEMPYTLDKTMITTGMGKAKAAVIRCGEAHPAAKGIVRIAVTISGAGSVTEASVSEAPDAALGECVAAAIRKTSFTATETGASVTYPFKF